MVCTTIFFISHKKEKKKRTKKALLIIIITIIYRSYHCRNLVHHAPVHSLVYFHVCHIFVFLINFALIDSFLSFFFLKKKISQDVFDI